MVWVKNSSSSSSRVYEVQTRYESFIMSAILFDYLPSSFTTPLVFSRSKKLSFYIHMMTFGNQSEIAGCFPSFWKLYNEIYSSLTFHFEIDVEQTVIQMVNNCLFFSRISLNNQVSNCEWNWLHFERLHILYTTSLQSSVERYVNVQTFIPAHVDMTLGFNQTRTIWDHRTIT